MRYWVMSITLLCFVQLSLDYLPQAKGKSKVFVNPPKNLRLLTFGFNDLMSSLLWVRVLQDMQICDQNSIRTPLPEFTQSDDPLAEILTRKMPDPQCQKGWVFQMLDVITDLTPDFYMAYSDGATMLSVVVDDREGANLIFAKGIQSFPDDWQLLYRAAYHEMFEMQNAERAAELMRRAGQRGAPQWVYSLSAKLYTRLGQAAFAKTILESVLERRSEGEGMERVKAQLETINRFLQDN
jgi:hypothetical protein